MTLVSCKGFQNGRRKKKASVIYLPTRLFAWNPFLESFLSTTVTASSHSITMKPIYVPLRRGANAPTAVDDNDDDEEGVEAWQIQSPKQQSVKKWAKTLIIVLSVMTNGYAIYDFFSSSRACKETYAKGYGESLSTTGKT